MRHLALAAALGTLLATLPARAAPPPLEDPFWGRDKALHFGFSAALAAGTYGASSLLFEGRKNHVAMGASVAISAGFAKEVVDAMGLGTPSWKDFVWDVIGTAVGIGVSLSLDYALMPASSGSGAKSSGAAPAR